MIFHWKHTPKSTICHTIIFYVVKLDILSVPPPKGGGVGMGGKWREKTMEKIVFFHSFSIVSGVFPPFLFPVIFLQTVTVLIVLKQPVVLQPIYPWDRLNLDRMAKGESTQREFIMGVPGRPHFWWRNKKKSQNSNPKPENLGRFPQIISKQQIWF